MTGVSAHAILAALRARRPGIGVKKAHKLLYYCQGHHLAAFGEPLFSERISAWDMGPVVGEVWHAEKHGHVAGDLLPLGEAALNTVGYVLSRYGTLSGADLERLTHHEPPWSSADVGRPSGTSAPIDLDEMGRFFRSASVVDDDEAPTPGSSAVQELLRGAHERRREPSEPDDLARLRRRIEGLRSADSRVG